MASKIQPRMLKEFLGDTPNNYDYSSSTGFESYPRNLPEYYYSDPNFQNLLQQATTVHNNNNNNNSQLRRSRSRSRAAAEAAMSSFQKLLNAVKSIHYSSTPSPLPRSLSRRLLAKWQMKKKRKSNDNNINDNNNNGDYNNGNNDDENSESSLSSEVASSKIVVVTVKVKDILRWRSFRDLVADHHYHHQNHEVSEEENESEPSDLVGPTDDAPSTSARNNFTVTEELEDLPCYGNDDNDDEEGKNWEEVVVASDSEVGPKEVEDYHKIGSEEGIEQQSPVSVLNSPFRDEVSDEENLSTFDQSLANMERTKQRLLQSIQLFESLAGVHDDDEDDDETEVTEEEQPREDDDTIITKRKDYVSKGFRWFEKGGEGIKDKKECIQGMEKQGQWSKFEEEKSEVGLELEFAVLDDLLDEVLFDLCG